MHFKGAGTSHPCMVAKENYSKTACSGILQLQLNYEVHVLYYSKALSP
jgi:hypothetical protein